MSDIQPYSRAGEVAPLTRRKTQRELEGIRNDFLVHGAGIEKERRLAEHKVDSVSDLGRRAANEIALLTQTEAALTKAVPLAGNRLEMIGEITTVGIAQVLSDGISKVRRA
jgi:hypothetical protein